MRRLLLVLLMLILPAQWTWAAAASYCQHEKSGSGQSHLGHHEHRHAELKADTAATADAQDLQQAGEHADCPSCHGACSAPLMQTASTAHAADPARVATPYQRAVTDGIPERLIRPPHRFLA